MKILLSLLLSVCVASGAITELYVKDAASGTGLGASEADAMSYVDFQDYMAVGGLLTAVAGNRFNCKVGAYADRTTTTDTWVNGGTATSPVIIRGYNTTIGDGSLGRTNDNGALILTNMPLFSYTSGKIIVSASNIIVESINLFVASPNAAAYAQTGNNSFIVRCKVTNTATGASASGIQIGTNDTAFDNDVFMTGATGGVAGINSGGASSTVDSNRISVISDTCWGIYVQNDSTIFGNVVFGNGGVGIGVENAVSNPFIRNNTIYGCVGDGINLVTGSIVVPIIIGNIIVDGSAFGLDATITTNPVFVSYNRYRDNVSGNIGNGGDWVTASTFGSVTTDTGGAETDFVSVAGGDFNLVTSSPARGIVPFKPMSAGANQWRGFRQTSGGFAK